MPNPVSGGLVGEYAMVDADIANHALPDSSGGANHGTLGLFANQWLFVPTVTAAGLSFAGGQLADLPAAVATLDAPRTLLIYADVPADPTIATKAALPVPLFYSATSMYLIGSCTRRVGRYADAYQAPLYSDLLSCAADAGGPMGLAFVDDGAAGKIYVNGSEITTYWRENVAWPSQASATYLRIGFNPVHTYTGQVYYALAYNRVLTGAEIASIHGYVSGILAGRSVAIAPASRPAGDRPLLICLGDSQTRGVGGGGNGNAYPDLAYKAMTRNYRVLNFSQGGAGTANVLALDSLVASLLSGGYGVPGQDVVALWIGTNNSWSQTAVDDIKTLVANYLSYGARAVVLVTGVSRSTEGGNLTRAGFNAQLRASCDGDRVLLADPGASVAMGQDGAYADGTYFADTVHPTAAGYGLVASMVGQALNEAPATYTPAAGGAPFIQG